MYKMCTYIHIYRAGHHGPLVAMPGKEGLCWPGGQCRQQGSRKPLPKLSNSDTSSEDVEGVFHHGRTAGTIGGRLNSKAGQAVTERKDVMEQLEGYVGLLSHQPGGPETSAQGRSRYFKVIFGGGCKSMKVE